MRAFKLLFSVILAFPFSSVVSGHAVSALGDQDWRTLAVPDSEPECNTPPAFFRFLKANRRKALASG
jgi:hypothetical protein